MDSDTLDALRRIGEANERLSEILTKQATESRPEAAAGVATQVTQPPTQVNRALTLSERGAMRQSLKGLSDSDMTQFLASQLGDSQRGIPLSDWLNKGGYSTQKSFEQAVSGLPTEIRKAIDSTAAAPLIRQDLEPALYEIFVRVFPFYDRLQKEPANGLVHAWNQITSYGGAAFMAELGTVTDDQSTYQRQTTNVAILASRRGVSLKSQFAVIAGGMNYNPEALELQGGLRALAHVMQRQIFSGQASATGGTYANEYGQYDANAFDGLRYLLGTGTQGTYVVNVDPATNPTSTGNIRRAVDNAITNIIQNGGTGPLEIWSHPIEKRIFDEQQDANVRILEAAQRGASIGVVTQAVNTMHGQIGWNIVPGDSIDPTAGSTGYVPSSNVVPAGYNTVRDIYIVDPTAISIPYLGTEGPTVLDIPVGISGQLTRLFIVFLMNGLAPKALIWHNKIRVKLT